MRIPRRLLASCANLDLPQLDSCIACATIKLKYRKVKCEHGKDVADWWLKQKPMCYICGKNVSYEKAPSRKKSRSNLDELVIDHNHNIKKFIPRHLLCQRHNLGYGMFQESIEQLQRAIKYKRKYG